MNAMHFVAARQLGQFESHGSDLADHRSSAGSPTADGEASPEDVSIALNPNVPITTLDPALSRKAAAILQERHRRFRRPLALKCRKTSTWGKPKGGRWLTDSETSSGDEDSSNADTSISSSDSDLPPVRGTKKRQVHWAELLKKRLPPVGWVPQLTFAAIRADVIAGLTVGIMVIPQSMSYANVAGLPYIIGMYSACVPAIVYALLGQSRQLAVGPVAMVSLMMEVGLTEVLTVEQCPKWYELGGRAQEQLQSDLCPEAYAGAAFLTSLVLGLVQVLAAFFGLSFLVTFLGHPVISGFSSGAAIIIGLSQFKYLLGVTIPRSEEVYMTVYHLANAMPEALKEHWMTMILGFSWLAFLFGTRKLSQRSPRLKFLGPIGPLVSCTAGILLLVFCKPLREKYGVRYVGEIPSGTIPMSIGSLSLSNVPAVIQTALTASLIGFMESIAISKNLATQHGYKLEAGQELFALGLANVAGSFFSCYPVTGSFSRSAVNNTTGAQTQLAGLVTAILMLCTLLFLTRLFYYLPMFALAAIVVNSVISLVAYDVAIELFKVKKYDFLLWVLAFLGTLLFGVLPGVAVAVLASLMVVIFESVRPSITVLWRVPGTAMYRSIEQESRGVLVPNLFIARIGASMYFANSSYIKDSLLAYIADLEDITPVEYVVLDMSSVNSLDSTAVHTVKDIVADFRHRGIEVAFVTVGSYVERTMTKAHVLQYIGNRWIFQTVHAAVHGCLLHQRFRLSSRSFSSHLSFSGRQQEERRERRGRPDRTLTVELAQEHEVGFSNETHRDFTVAFVQLQRDVPGISDIILNVFRQSGVEVPRREIAGLMHSYYLQARPALSSPGRQSSKLTDKEMTQLKAELDVVIGRCSAEAFPVDARVLELERELQEARERIKALESQVAGASQERAGSAGSGCLFAAMPATEQPLRQ